jgi:hypothetical protein
VDTLTWEEVAKLAPIATACVALFAAFVATRAINAQRDIAMRRAAIDFFLKTEMDEKLIVLYKSFKKHTRDITKLMGDPNFMERTEYHDIRTFLNICELISVGVNEKAFSNKLSYKYWCNVLPESYNAALLLVQKIRTTPGEGKANTYIELEKLCNNWRDRPPI